MKSNPSYIFVVLLLALGLCDSARAQEALPTNFSLGTSLLYYTTLRSRNSREEKTFVVGDLRASYQFAPNWIAGLIYQSEEYNTKNSGFASPSDNNSARGTRISWGPSVGYMTPSYHVIFHYHYQSQLKLNTSNSTGATKSDYKGNGMQLDVGYKIPLWKGLIGPQLSYKNYTYTSLSTNGAAAASISPKLKESNLEPSLVFFYFF